MAHPTCADWPHHTGGKIIRVDGCYLQAVRRAVRAGHEVLDEPRQQHY